MATHQDLTGAQWRKPSYSGSSGGECVEVAGLAAHVAVRDSRNPEGPALTVTPAAFAAFVAAWRLRPARG